MPGKRINGRRGIVRGTKGRHVCPDTNLRTKRPESNGREVGRAAVGTVPGAKLSAVDSAPGLAMANTCYRGYLEFNQAPGLPEGRLRVPRTDVMPRDR